MDIREKAAQASSILNNEVFKEAVSNIETTLITEWKNCSDPVIRDRYWAQINALKAIVENLRAFIDDNKIVNK
jgi:TATA-binding protein-associated factor Taf7